MHCCATKIPSVVFMKHSRGSFEINSIVLLQRIIVCDLLLCHVKYLLDFVNIICYNLLLLLYQECPVNISIVDNI